MTIIVGNTVAGKQAGMLLEKKLRDYIFLDKLEKNFWNLNPTSLQMTHLLQWGHTFSKEFHQLGTKSSNLWACGGHSHANHHIPTSGPHRLVGIS